MDTKSYTKWQQHQEEGTQAAWEIPTVERGAIEDVEAEGNSGPCGNRSTQDSDAQIGQAAPADSWNDIFVQRSAVLGTKMTLHRALKIPGL